MVFSSMAFCGDYTPGTKGWWWYEPVVEKKEEKQQKKKEKEAADNQKDIKLSDFTYKQLWEMHPDRFSRIFTSLQKKAVMTLREDDVRDFYIVMDIARKKSLSFANVANYVVHKYPQLNVAKDYPTSYQGRIAYNQSRQEEIKHTIFNASEDFALLYFYSPECHYCKAQSEIINIFINRYGWTVKSIDILRKAEIARQFKTSYVPALILIYRKSSDYIPVSLGVITLAELESKLYRTIRVLKGDIAPQDFSLFEFQRGSSFDSKEGGILEEGIRKIKAEVQ
jgi:conjugal transfer pilus assembly protein TraF